MDHEWKHRANAAAYVGLYPFLRDVAKLNGYALAVHGSLANDFDLIAVPWVMDAARAGKLIQELAEVVGAEVGKDDPAAPNPGIKPHGRLAWTVHFGRGPYMDISVMPKDRDRTTDAYRKLFTSTAPKQVQNFR